ncbi:another transcription unit protein [Drosophila innubila]|uniref:another transcription unit protein n=1 Tax=Drosophila innubila TaxID=198719 RepID=UPI00148C3069|nr:another transcription unit protein [Drosophila innubila]
MSRALDKKNMSNEHSDANCEESRNELSREIVPSTSVNAVPGIWIGCNLSSSSSDNECEGDVENDNEEDGNSSSGSGSGSESGSDSSSDDSGDASEKIAANDSENAESESETEDAVAIQVAEHFREKFKDKLTAEFKAELPKIETDLTNSHPILIRVPNFMPVVLDAYEDHTYSNSIAQDDLKDNESREAFITKLKTTVRWRVSQDKSTGALYKESNARFVRWSDGSQTFHVGGEAFDVIRHPVASCQNQLYICLGNYYQQQCSIKEKLTLRPKLESNFGLSHVQGLRKRAFYKPMSNCVKILTDLTTNPVLDRERKAKEEWAQCRKEKGQQRRDQLNQRKPVVKPMKHCTADDFEGDAPMQEPYNINLANGSSAIFSNEANCNSGIGIINQSIMEGTKNEAANDFEPSDNDLENLSD